MASASQSRSISLRRGTRWGLFGVVLGLFFLAGCSTFSSEEKPLPDSTFARVLTDLHLADARRSMEGLPTPPGLRDSILSHHGVRPSDLEATLRYYSRRPRIFGAFYQSIIDTLQARQRINRRPSRTDTTDADTARSDTEDQERSP